MRLVPLSAMLIVAAAACARMAPSSAPSRRTSQATKAPVRTASRLPKTAHWDFESTHQADAWFLNLLKDAGALPRVIAHHAGLGYAVESDASQLLVLDSDGLPFLFRRCRGNGSALEAIGGGPWKNVNLYEPAARMHERAVTEDRELDLGEMFKVESGTRTRTFLAFTGLAVVHPGPMSKSAIPENVIARDMILEPSETLDASYCLKDPSGRHCLAIYSTLGHDRREARLVVALYDTAWLLIGSTGRSPSRWGENAGVWLPPFEIEAMLNVDGLDAPIFVTSAFTTECPCSEFWLNSFTEGGQFASVRIENGIVVDPQDGDVCVCSI